MKIRDARSLSSDAQEDLRIKAVKAVLTDRQQIEVADLFGDTRQAVGKWTTAFKKGGKRALKAKKRGRPKATGVVRCCHGRPHRSSLPLKTDVLIN